MEDIGDQKWINEWNEKQEERVKSVISEARKEKKKRLYY